MVAPDKKRIESEYRKLQQHICEAIEKADGKGSFLSDEWTRNEGGGGLTRIMNQGHVLEKAGVNFSAVFGDVTESMSRNLGMEANTFFATGVSIVMHPNSPHVPIIHMNVRYFETDTGTYWFGGGIDLTPHYVNKEDARFFHQRLKEVCDRYEPSYYSRFKTWADDYFYIPHREETRGIGGIFYDHLSGTHAEEKESLLQFSIDLGMAFPEIYEELIRRNRDKPHSENEREWQLLRRGRYVEFNLVYDRGTRFGLLSNGRTESILMSLPLDARWKYNFHPSPGSPEAQTLEWLRKGVDWLSEG
jgi:coproporphyrinogen III oxidase